MSGFEVNQLFGLPTAKIFCALSGFMLLEASGDIEGDARV